MGMVCHAPSILSLLIAVTRSGFCCRTFDTDLLLDRTRNFQRFHVADSGNELRWYVAGTLTHGTTN